MVDEVVKCVTKAFFMDNNVISNHDITGEVLYPTKILFPCYFNNIISEKGELEYCNAAHGSYSSQLEILDEKNGCNKW